MKITEALLAEHAVFHNLFDYVERVTPKLKTLAEVKSLASLLGVFLRRDYLVDSIGLRRLLERHLPYRHLEEAALPIHVVASDMTTGDEVLLSSGVAVDAVLASTASPGVFPAVSICGKLLVDGGVANNTPISAAIRLGAERVIVLPTGFACALKHIPRGPIARSPRAASAGRRPQGPGPCISARARSYG